MRVGGASGRRKEGRKDSILSIGRRGEEPFLSEAARGHFRVMGGRGWHGGQCRPIGRLDLRQWDERRTSFVLWIRLKRGLFLPAAKQRVVRITLATCQRRGKFFIQKRRFPNSATALSFKACLRPPSCLIGRDMVFTQELGKTKS